MYTYYYLINYLLKQAQAGFRVRYRKYHSRVINLNYLIKTFFSKIDEKFLKDQFWKGMDEKKNRENLEYRNFSEKKIFKK